MSDADTIKALQRVVAEQERELLALRPQVAALTTKTYCAYCGEATDLDDDAATKVGEHIRRCPKHPIAEYRHRCDELEAQVAALTAERDLLRVEDLTAIAKAVAAEREMCAKVAEAGAVVAEQECAWESAIVLRGVAAAIRARGGQ